MAELTAEEQVVRANAVARFHEDPTIQAIFGELKIVYFNQWYAADTLTERELVWAKARALGDVQVAMDAVVQSGERATWDESQRVKHQQD